MNRTAWLQDRRMTKFSEVLGRWRSRQLSAVEAGEILGMLERTFRRFRQRYEDEGEAGLADRRLGKASVTRYDRCAHTFFSAICIAAVVIFWINQ